MTCQQFPACRMIVQIYEVSTPAEAGALGAMGVDHIGVLVGDGSFPREHNRECSPDFCGDRRGINGVRIVAFSRHEFHRAAHLRLTARYPPSRRSRTTPLTSSVANTQSGVSAGLPDAEHSGS